MSLTDQLAYYEMEADAIKKVCKALSVFRFMSSGLVYTEPRCCPYR